MTQATGGDGRIVMELRHLITHVASMFREFVAPRYRPELYYMRGPGPACARRVSTRRVVSGR